MSSKNHLGTDRIPKAGDRRKISGFRVRAHFQMSTNRGRITGLLFAPVGELNPSAFDTNQHNHLRPLSGSYKGHWLIHCLKALAEGMMAIRRARRTPDSDEILLYAGNMVLHRDSRLTNAAIGQIEHPNPAYVANESWISKKPPWYTAALMVLDVRGPLKPYGPQSTPRQREASTAGDRHPRFQG